MSEQEITRMEDNLYWYIQHRDCTLELANCTTLPFKLIHDTTGQLGRLDAW